ncbi:hypothetical protein FRF71_14800 [Novosphingobium ginsenosidimutans]|uniref:Uncharacterized protein n=1 Tax=Novosphingobium ginsenosidimutans TaxID=1176536 RepID=A0A5B8SAX8_9SPHN|nr:hypothetical protein FRF71_14800 [Novosphingobium ginsenosidimutans]
MRRIGNGLLDCTLPRAEWTHEAHLAACLWLLTERPDILPERDLPAIIRRYNESVGGVNDDTQGYHETLTQLYIRGVRRFLTDSRADGLAERVNALLSSAVGAREWPLRFYSREVLFSVAARRGWIAPELTPI